MTPAVFASKVNCSGQVPFLGKQVDLEFTSVELDFSKPGNRTALVTGSSEGYTYDVDLSAGAQGDGSKTLQIELSLFKHVQILADSHINPTYVRYPDAGHFAAGNAYKPVSLFYSKPGQPNLSIQCIAVEDKPVVADAGNTPSASGVTPKPTEAAAAPSTPAQN
jgi:hypothetical protein